MTYRCEFYGGDLDGLRIPLETAEQLTNLRTEDLSYIRQRGGFTRREELDNKPELPGYIGPMWDGTRPGNVAVLRYETQDIYDAMSR